MRTPRQWLSDRWQPSRDMDWPKPPEGSRWAGLGKERKFQVNGPVEDLHYRQVRADWDREQREKRQREVGS